MALFASRSGLPSHVRLDGFASIRLALACAYHAKLSYPCDVKRFNDRNALNTEMQGV